MEVLMMAVMAIANILCFIVGAKVGQAVSKGEKIEAPTVDPLKIYRDNQEKKAAKEEQKAVEALLHNIDMYDGTGNGQKDLPRG